EVLSSEFSGQKQDDIRDMTRFQGYLGGPVPLLSKMSFFLSGTVTGARDYTVFKDDSIFDLYVDPTDPTTRNPDIDYYDMPDDWADFDPAQHNPYLQRQMTGYNWRLHPIDIYSGWLGFGFRNEWSGMGNFAYKVTPSIKLTLSGSLNGTERIPYNDFWRFSSFWGYPDMIQKNCVWGTERWDADAVDPITGEPLYDRQDERIIPLTGDTDFHNEKNQLGLDNQRLALVWTHQLNQSTFYSIRGSYYEYNRTMRVKRWVNEDGWKARFEHLYPATGDTLWHQSDTMTQLTLEPIRYGASDDHDRRYGYVPYGNAGMGYLDGSDRYYTNHIDITRTIKSDITSQLTTHHQVKTGMQYNALTLDQYDNQNVGNVIPYVTRYRHTPWELGLYIQDKIEYDFIILNLGVRYDAANAGELPFWLDPRNPVDEEGNLVLDPSNPETAPVKTGRVRSQFSPRVGISHPITERSVIYFNYGHFYQNPIYRNMYIQNTIEEPGALIGNPNMENEKTVSYEFGYKHQFTEIFALELTMWAKDSSNMVGSERVPAFFQGSPNPYDYTVFLNYDYSSSKGIDLSLIKRYSGYWSARCNYSYMTTAANSDDPWQGYRRSYGLETGPKRPRVLAWDQPHRFSSSISLSVPQGVGPTVFGVHLFERVNASLIYVAAAGKPYTPRTKEKALERNSGRRPWTYLWSAKFYRDFESFGLRYSIFADIRNLFDRKNVILVWSRTGKPDDPGPGATDYSDIYDASEFYEQPRSIDIGIRIFF
ncbi:TonB-dependent receptor plug domain-containing protein, partial [Gemmatimonadota bacterium]